MLRSLRSPHAADFPRRKVPRDQARATGRTAMKRVSSRDDFPNVDVYERDGPVYMVSFRNRETYEDFGAFWRMVVCFGAAMAAMAAMAGAIQYLPWWVSVIVIPGLFVLFFVWIWTAKKVWRSIELDPGRDRLRVFRK